MEIIRKKRTVQRKKSFTKLVRNQSLRDYIQDYCNSTSIHGIKYLGETGRPLGERLSWVLIFIICFYVNGYLIQEVWDKWNDSPVIVSFAETATPVWNVPFPAVTICSEVKSRSKIFNFTYYMSNDIFNQNTTDDTTKQKIGDLTLVCDAHVQVNGEKYAEKRTMDFLLEVTPPFSDTVWECKWSDLATSCPELFTQILTQEGFCYTFNMLDKEDLLRGDPFPFLQLHGNRTTGWSLDGGYTHNAPLLAYPRRAFSAGSKAGLTIRMRARDEETDFYCRGPVLGFKVLLHNPAEIPLVRERYLRSPLNQDVVVVVQPNIMDTSPGLLTYDPHRRQCFFPAERYLKFFKVYTQRNCELECLTNHTLEVCGCVGIHMPRYNETKFCGAGKKQCMITAEEELRLKEVAASYKGTSVTCDCLPACTSIQYNSENTQANFASESTVISEKDNTTKSYKESRISIFFKEMQFTTSRRSELFGVVDFMAHCGGLLGLCCGMSFLSILELIYYITFRIWGNIKTKNKEEKKKKEEEKETPETASAAADDAEKKGIAFIDWKNK
ncbi:pickpocket protein 28 [Halyomorpha halys]|uniref:pickpocket protein 28 n=1 Tax=Halyomorpha halys TaxID=286706 RepID=UPI0006D4CEEB|nr:pickpocket protein 28-like [Halyomorpha halys]